VTDVPIASPDNPLVKQVVRLHEVRHRRAEARFIAEGRRTIEAFLANGWKAEHLIVRSGEEPPSAWPREQLRMVSERVAAKMSQASTASGYLGVFSIPPVPALQPASGGLVLAGITDPGNLGTLIRSAAAFGVAHLALLGGADPFSHKVVQASAGALASVPISPLPEESGPELLAGGAPLCALVVSGGLDPARLPRQRRWLVVGSEAHGLRPDWLAGCPERVTLPMQGPVDSLNAAIAGSIACYLLGTPNRASGAVGESGR
jgi:TrmH family RNA methyltransferase